MERRLGRAYDVRGAREAGISQQEILDESNTIVSEWNEELGKFYDVKGAWDAGLTLDEIGQEIGEVYKDLKYGSIREAPEPGMWDFVKRAWERAGRTPGRDAMYDPRGDTMGSKLLATVMTPLNVVADIGMGASDAATAGGGMTAEALGKAAPGLPAGIPAAAGLVQAEATDLLNWVGPAVVKRAARPVAKAAGLKVAPTVAEQAAGQVKKAGFMKRAGAWLDKATAPQVGKYHHALTPRGIRDIAQGLEDLGGAVVRPGVSFVKGVREGLGQPKEIQEALATMEGQAMQSIDDLDQTTRIHHLAEIGGKEKALAGEAAQVAEREERRQIELLKRRGMTEGEARAKIEAERAPEEVTLMKPWERLAQEAEAKKTNPVTEVAEHGELMEDAAKAYKLGDLETASPDEVFTTGRKGEPAPLREESRTFRKYWNDPDNTLFNSIKYWVGRFLADPSAVIPKIAHEAGRVFDRMNETKQVFYRGVSEAVQGLDQTEKTVVALMLDTHPEDWGALMRWTSDPKIGLAYQKLKKVLDKLADVEGLQRQERLGDYFPHILGPEKEWKGAKGLVDTETNTAAFAVPARSWMPRETADEAGRLADLINRKAALGEVFDLENVLAIRINAGLRKAYFNPMIKTWEPRIEGLTEGGQAYAKAYLNKLLGRPGKIFEGVEKALSKIKIGGKSYSLHDLNRYQLAVTMNYYRGLLGLALDTAFKNLGQVQNTISQLGFRNAGRGAGRLFAEMFLTPEARKVFKKSGVMADYETIVTGAADMLNRGKVWQNIDKILFAPMRFSEYLNRGTAFHAGLATAYARGKRGKAAVEYAKQMVDKTQFRYGVTNTSPYLQNPFGKLWYQFGSYPMKETLFVNDILQDPDKRKIMRLLLFHGMVYGGGKVAGAELMDAMGYTEVKLPWTGDKATDKEPVSIMLPTGIFPHLGVYSAPAMRLAASVPAAAGELAYYGEPRFAAQELINNLANLLPARRYLEKVYQAQQKLQSGVSNRVPRLQEHAVSMMKGQGPKRRKHGGRGAQFYTGYDFLREMVGVRPKDKR